GLPAPGPGRRPKRACRPGLETLEGRLVPATFTVTTPLDVVDANDGQLSLREAVLAANDNPGPDTIVLPAGTYKVRVAVEEVAPTLVTAPAGTFTVTHSTLFQGAGANDTVIDGQHFRRVFDVLGGAAPRPIEATFQGLTIRNGRADVMGGGGIHAANADLVLRDSVVTGNQSFGNGGGIA